MGAWAILAATVISRDVQAGWMPPRPAPLFGSAVVYSGLAAIASVAAPLAVALAVGIDVASLVAPFLTAGGKAAGGSPIDALTGLVSSVSGVTPKAAPAGLGGGPDWRMPA